MINKVIRFVYHMVIPHGLVRDYTLVVMWKITNRKIGIQTTQEGWYFSLGEI